MLIEFSVSNFRSFREKQTLSMVASPRLGKKQNVFDPELEGESFPKLLKVAAIYGPNASGKSNLVKAFDVIPALLRRSPGANYSIPVMPFRFDSELAAKPSLFEAHFIEDNLRFQYVIAATSERIFEETLSCYPKGKESLLFSRKFSPDTGESYVFGEALEGGGMVHEAWKRLTAPQSLFLAQAVLNSSEELQQLKSPYQWLESSNLCIGQDGMNSWSLASRSMVMQTPGAKDSLQSFMQRLDVPITDIRFEKKTEFDYKKGPHTEFNDYLMFVGKESNTKLTHTTALGDVEFDFSEESGGTQNLIGFWLPWMNLNMSSKGSVVVIDELDSSLHPKIVESLIKEHLAGNKNTQLIFTTHDTHLMNTKLLRRDQFWVTERDTNGATQMFSIHDFKGRDSEDVEKRYYEGRYRGLPILSRS
ncbi:ATP-binding protein [Pseudomonas kairouanensis]|uniref:ATP-binding protein n=1 Tax=Pseudomonas kairouanensis TaxID=2293832 RepID=A0A4Z0AT08_9PSED|nr:ATP-binding protein [Pseudomonas kairouanensis]TFY89299.1 ATP-binding protein [Pseudomonas kairouanensis]